MKLVTKVTTAIAALAAVAMLASCGSTSGASEASAPASSGASASSGNASVWEWASVPLSDIGTNDTVIDDRFILDPVSNPLGAEFAAVAGKAKFKTEDLGTALYLQNKAATTKDNVKDVFQAAFEVVVKAPATVTLSISGNGDATPARVFGVFDPSGAMIASVDNLGQDAKSELKFDAPAAGTYTIKASGTRIYGVKVEAK